ncbi:LysR family transcriptional regulator [Celeribacter neptunius]|uniref:DNA-binding transcriptional regulator, LysR family n=1 Tax=Celeribacter neptunius TaxID=588602 RepID=A0A1I3P330_9RHOB|nr:LysR family transcriptional regulator [Celeribacter neptunius]SFJ15965.1 DNA-binding transcriptional regulator, LysR family [Celeribacter neptunius]
MDMFRAMALFRAVAEAGSFVSAAEREGLSSPALSRQIAGLEDRLGARLFNRTTRRLSLTEAGQRFLARTESILSELDEAESEAGEGRLSPRGILKISAPITYSLARLGPVLASFRAAYPDLDLSIDLSDRAVDLVHEAVDVALRVSATPAPNLIARKLADEKLIACAAPAYLARHGTPECPEDLQTHEFLLYSYLAAGRDYRFSKDGAERVVRLSGHVEATNGDILRDMAIAGHGMVIQPGFVVERALEAGQLVRVLPDWQSESFGVYAVYSSRRHLPLKTRVFIDHLVGSLG